MIIRFTPPRYFFVCRVIVGFGSVKPKLNSSSACTFLSWFTFSIAQKVLLDNWDFVRNAQAFFVQIEDFKQKA